MPLVLLTSMGVRSDNPDFANAAFASCLTKPIKPAQLQQVLVQLLSAPTAGQIPANTKLDPKTASRLPLKIFCAMTTSLIKRSPSVVQQMGYRADLSGNGCEALASLDKQSYDLISWTS